MRINTNISAQNTYSRLTAANTAKSGSLAKLSSGLRINKAGDDAAGLAISEKMKNQVSGMTQASRNAQDGISLIQTAEGALKETHSILNRMRDLTVQASNDTNTNEDRESIQKELESLTDEVGRIAKDTQFNTKGLLNGTTGASEGSPAVPGGQAVPAETVMGGAATTELNKANPIQLAEAFNEVTETTTDKTITADLVAEMSTMSKEDINNIVTKYNEKAAVANGIASDTAVVLNPTTISEAITETDAQDAVAGTPAVPASIGSTSFNFQIGANAGENISVTIGNMTAEGLGIDNLNVNPEAIVRGDDPAVAGNQDTFGAILETIDSAIKSVSDQRANLGAVQNRLDHTVSNLATTKENLSEANSRIVDVDMAEEMMSFTKSNILSQAATSMLAQANQMPQGVLQLLG